MEALKLLLKERENTMDIAFEPLDRRIRCYAHIINICSSHIIASMTPTSRSYLVNLKVPVDSNYATYDGSDDDSDDDSDYDSPIHGIDEARLAASFDFRENPKFRRWVSGIQRNPLGRARKLITFLRSSDQRKAQLSEVITEGNQKNSFIGTNNEGEPIVIQLPKLELLRDVKTRWDSVYMMLERLRQYRPVRLSYKSDVSDQLNAST
jgi:predicted nucleic acid-binding OB-fold protein